MFIGGILSLVFLIWMVSRIWKDSALMAIASVFLWPVLIFALFKYWGDEESDIKLPFVLWILSVGYAWHDMNQMSKALKEQQETLLAISQFFA
jgi:hypothetical protein